MKKNIFLITMLATSSPLVLYATTSEADCIEYEMDAEESGTEPVRCDETDEFENFFCTENTCDEAPRVEKAKPSRLQLAMIRLGVAVALRVESCCITLHSFYKYLLSWIGYEKRKA